MTIVQPDLEINVLTNPISAAPLLPQYSSSTHPAPLSRTILGQLIDRLDETKGQAALQGQNYISQSLQSSGSQQPKSLSSQAEISRVNLQLPAEMQEALISETVYALAALGGHNNPPARHIVGLEAVNSVKEKLKTVSEELEDFIQASVAVDFKTKHLASNAGR